MASLTIDLLGAPRVSLAGRPLDLRMRKELALLAYLAVEQGRPHRRDHLVGLLWPDDPEEAARNNLRVVLAGLRRTLGDAADAVLQIDRQQVRFLPDADHSVDVLAFRRLLDAVGAHSHTARDHCEACVTRLAEATELYSGDFLAGFSLRDSAPFDEWATVQRERLHQQQLGALETLASAAAQRGDYAGQCNYARRQLALEPWREGAHAQLMRGLWASGQRGAALEQFELCRRVLADELGLEPSPELAALAEQIRGGKETRRQGDKETRRQGDKETAFANAPGFGAKASPLPLSLSPPLPRAQRASPPLLVSPFPASAASISPSPASAASTPAPLRWPDIPEGARLYGRASELVRLQGWLVDEGCRLVALLGIGGIGKTSLAAAAARAVADHFDAVVWRSLLNAPPLDELLRDVLSRLEPGAHATLPSDPQAQIGLLLEALRRTRCLLVLDNGESLLRPDEPGLMREGYEGYAQLLRAVAERPHQSCLLLTSRERPQGMARWEADLERVCMLRLEGLDSHASQAILSARGLRGQEADARALVSRYSGHPLALKLVAQTVHELFDGSIGDFLREEALIFDDIRTVLDQQFARLSPLEQEILFWLAIEREPVPTAALRKNLLRKPASGPFLEALRTLQRRSLLEQHSAGFTLQNVVIEYLTARLIDGVCAELIDIRTLAQGMSELAVPLLNGFALLKTQAKEYVRQSQARLLLQPIAERLVAQFDTASLRSRIAAILDALRTTAPCEPSYAGGNLLNLLLHLRLDPSGYDFSRLSVWQADLRGVTSAAVNFSDGDLSNSAFTSVFSLSALRFNAAGLLLVAGLSGDELRVWGTADGGLHELFRRPGVGPRAIAFSNDGQLLATCGLDHSVQVWSTDDGERLHTLQGHTGPLLTLAFSSDGQRLASSSRDRTVRVWDLATGTLLHTLREHAAGISGLAFSTNGAMLAGGGDQVICLWDTRSGQVVRTLLGHSREIECFAFAPDDRQLVSGAHDGSIRVWEVATGQTLRTLQGHSQIVRAVALHPDGHTLASGGADRLVRLWDLRDGQILHTWADHAYEVVAIALSADGQVLASGSVDPTVKLWDTHSGNALDTFKGHGEIIRSVHFSPNGELLASSGASGLVRLWNVGDQTVRSLPGHTREIRAVVFSPDGRLLASGGADQIVRIWDVASGTIRHKLRGHTNTIKALAFRPDGRVLASGGSDRTIRLWPIGAAAPGEQAECVLRGHTDEISALVFSRDGRSLLSCGLDHTARLWAINGERETRVLAARGCTLSGVVFSPDGLLAVASSYNGTVHLWDVESGERRELWSGGEVAAVQVAFSPDGTTLACMRNDQTIEIRHAASGAVLQRLRGHRGAIEAIAFSSGRPILASSGWDGTIRLWDVASGACLEVLRAPGPYAGMGITGVTGITEAQRASLVVLGAIDGGVPPGE